MIYIFKRAGYVYYIYLKKYKRFQVSHSSLLLKWIYFLKIFKYDVVLIILLHLFFPI